VAQRRAGSRSAQGCATFSNPAFPPALISSLAHHRLALQYRGAKAKLNNCIAVVARASPAELYSVDRR